jgi:hypothetical protein
MFILGMMSLLVFSIGIVLATFLLYNGKEASPLQAIMGQLAIVASVITGGASTVNVFKERKPE